MKERIQQLADQCWTEDFHLSPNGPENLNKFDYEKFAKLIAKECARICDGYDSVDAVLISNLIRRKFGT